MINSQAAIMIISCVSHTVSVSHVTIINMHLYALLGLRVTYCPMAVHHGLLPAVDIICKTRYGMIRKF